MWRYLWPIASIWKDSVLSEPLFESDQLSIFRDTVEEIPFDTQKALQVLSSIEHEEKCTFAHVEVVFVDEDRIVAINEQYLNKNYITDIITFRYDEDETRSHVEATLFCCSMRIKEQAEEFNEPQNREFLRIFIHGLLHLCGYNDDTEEAKNTIRERENYYLDAIQI